MSANLLPIKRALISVYDKTGLEDLAQALHLGGVEIVSTGSTAARIAAAGIPVIEVSQVTGFPECLDGRVKTLHPRIHAGILADRRLESHRLQLKDLQIAPFDLVVCNLYPFSETIASGAGFQDCIEQIDIGGPSMVRAAAKNHANLAVVVSPAAYPQLIAALAHGGFTAQQRRELAAAAFAHTAQYDAQISTWFAGQLAAGVSAVSPSEPAAGRGEAEVTSKTASFNSLVDQGKEKVTAGAPDPNDKDGKGVETGLNLDPAQVVGQLQDWNPQLKLLHSLRYGENPHQAAAVYAFADQEGGLAQAEQLNGKPMSYNNYQDADAAWRAVWEHESPCVAVVKHANPCGIALGNNITQAHRRAHACDPLSAYGGVIAANRPVTLEMAQQVRPIFTEVILAPDYQAEALEILQQKKNLRILRLATPHPSGFEIKQISGGLLCQVRDQCQEPGDYFENWTLAAGPGADVQTAKDLQFAWRAIRAVKSNAILLAKDEATVGIGMGQVNRVDSCRLAVERANTLGPVVETAAPGVDLAGVGKTAAGQKDAVGGLKADPGHTREQRALGSVAASDAFFPFADGPASLIAAGVKAIVQPGGSIRDPETIQVCQDNGVSLYLTGVRHFWH